MAFRGLEGDTILTLGFAFAFWTLLAPCILCFETGGSKNSAPNLALNGNTGGKEQS
jgi:hypothetical protein